MVGGGCLSLAKCLVTKTRIDAETETLIPTHGGHFVDAVSCGIRTANTSSNGWGIQEEATHTLDGAMGVAVATLLGGIDYENNGHTADQPTGPLLKGSPTLDSRPCADAIAFQSVDHGADATENLSPTLRRHDPMAVMSQMQVRRLTPTECERLQGFPDNYTLVPHRNKPAADGPRYKALGNSWAVPVVRWIGERIKAAL